MAKGESKASAKEAAKEERVIVQINPALAFPPERVVIGGKTYHGGETVSASEYEELIAKARDARGRQFLVKTATVGS